MDSRDPKGNPENRSDRSPLASRRLKRELMKNRFVPHKKTPTVAEATGAESSPRLDEAATS
jgi:hypothetical protein